MGENANGHPPDPNISLAAVSDSMIDGLGQLASYFGFSKVMGQLYGALLLSPEPMCLDDLMVCLNISKASVSMNMRTLEHMGMVRQVWVRGTGGRRKYYESQTDFWQIIRNILAGREMRDVERAISVMDENEQLLRDSMNTMSEEDQEIARLYIDRMTKMRGLFEFAQLMIGAVLAQAEEIDLDDVSSIEIQ